MIFFLIPIPSNECVIEDMSSHSDSRILQALMYRYGLDTLWSLIAHERKEEYTKHDP